MKRSKKMLAMVTTLLLILILTVPVSAAGKISKKQSYTCNWTENAVKVVWYKGQSKMVK